MRPAVRRGLVIATMGVVVAATVAGGAAQTPAVQAPTTHTYVIAVRGSVIGREHIGVSATSDGWRIESTGQQSAPVDFQITKFEAAYDTDWQPRSLSVEGTRNGALFLGDTTVTGGAATTRSTQAGATSSVTHQVSPHSVLLPNNFFGAYAALAMQLRDAKAGATFPIYVVPQAEITATLDRVIPKRIDVPGEGIDVRECDLTFTNPSGPVAVQVWVDAQGLLARVVVPSASLLITRDDLATVMARVENVRNPNDAKCLHPRRSNSRSAPRSRRPRVRRRGPGRPPSSSSAVPARPSATRWRSASRFSASSPGGSPTRGSSSCGTTSAASAKAAAAPSRRRSPTTPTTSTTSSSGCATVKTSTKIAWRWPGIRKGERSRCWKRGIRATSPRWRSSARRA